MKKTDIILTLAIVFIGTIPLWAAATTIGDATGGLTQGTSADNSLVGDQCKQVLQRVYHGGEALGITNLNPDFACRLAKYVQANPGCTINSAWRSQAHQDALFAKSDGSGHMVAKNSNHTKGIAADLAGPCTATNHKAAPEQFGLWFRMSWEPWHIEPNGAVQGGGAQTSPPAGSYSSSPSSGATSGTGSSMPSMSSGGSSGGTSGGTTSGTGTTYGAQQQLIYPSQTTNEDYGASSDAQIRSIIGTSTYDTLAAEQGGILGDSSWTGDLGTSTPDAQFGIGDSQTPPDQSSTGADQGTKDSTDNSYTSPDMNDMITPYATALNDILNGIKKELLNIIAELSGQQ